MNFRTEEAKTSNITDMNKSCGFSGEEKLAKFDVQNQHLSIYAQNRKEKRKKKEKNGNQPI